MVQVLKREIRLHMIYSFMIVFTGVAVDLLYLKYRRKLDQRRDTFRTKLFLLLSHNRNNARTVRVILE